MTDAMTWQSYELQKLEKRWMIDQNALLVDASETDKLAAKKQYLNDKLYLVNAQLEDAQIQLKKTTEKYGENSGEVQKASLSLMDLQIEQAKTKAELEQVSEALAVNSAETDKLAAKKQYLNDKLYLVNTAFSKRPGPMGKGKDPQNRSGVFLVGINREHVRPLMLATRAEVKLARSEDMMP